MDRFPKVGDHVVYHDERGQAHDALLTAVWGQKETCEGWPCVNLLFASDNASQQDEYGRQIVRKSSCVHGNRQTAHGNYWRFADEKANPVKEGQT